MRIHTSVLAAAVALEGLKTLPVPAQGQGNRVPQPSLEHRHNLRADSGPPHVPYGGERRSTGTAAA